MSKTSTVSPPSNIPSSTYRIFLGFACFVFCVNLLIMNDFATLWNGAEVELITQSFSETAPKMLSLPALKMRVMAQFLNFHEFLFRLPSVLMTMLGLIGLFFGGRRVFGLSTTADALLVLGSSLLVVNLGKVATGDSWLFALLSLNFITLILYLKQPILKWQISHLGLLILAAWVHPLSTIVFSIVTTTYLFWLHPTGHHLKGLYHWLVLLILLPIFHYTNSLNPSLSIFYISYQNISMNQYLLAMFVLGMLPWTGFVWAGLWEMLQKLRKKEEFAIITSAGLVAGLASQSLVVQTFLAFIVARQLKAYFHPNYPYKNIVKTGAILHLLFAIAGIIYFVIASFDAFYLVGFRSGLAVGAVYWMPCLLGVIGLVGMNLRFIKGGMAMSGLLLTLFFWLQSYPLVETQRNLPKRVAQEIANNVQAASKSSVQLYHLPYPISQNIAFYLQQQSFNSEIIEPQQHRMDFPVKEIMIVTDDTFSTLLAKNPDLQGIKLVGWSSLCQEEVLWMLKK